MVVRCYLFGPTPSGRVDATATFAQMRSGDIDLVLFDLGGVLIQFEGVAALRELAGLDTAEEALRRWLESRWVQRFERGECSPDQFSSGVVVEWGLPVTPERFLDLFRQWPIGPFDGAADLLAEVKDQVPVGCLSNTNVVHWTDQLDRWAFLGQFDFRFLSFELGRVKPDPAVFEVVAGMLPYSRDRVLFLDDSAVNVDGARSRGFVAEHVCGVDASRGVLFDAGIIDSSSPVEE